MAPLIRLQDHITAVLQLELSLGVCASQGGEAMVFETVSFLQSYFKQFTVSAWQSRRSSYPTAVGVLGFISIFSFFMCRAFCRAQREWDSLFRYSGRRKERPLLVVQDKNFWNCHKSAIIKYSIFRPCWLHSKWTLIMLDSAVWKMAERKILMVPTLVCKPNALLMKWSFNNIFSEDKIGEMMVWCATKI